MKLKVIALLALAAITVQAQKLQVDKDLPVYKPVSGVSGKLNSIGSDTLNNLMAKWTEEFKKLYPNVKTQVEGKGSSTAPPALIAGTSQLGPMSREMKNKEVDAFEKKFGYKPTRIKVSIDALAVFVHKDNPIKGLTLQQVDSIFSKTRKRGGQPITKWGQAGLQGDIADESITLYGRNSASGTYGYFKKVALKKGDFLSSVKEMGGSSAVIQSISVDKKGIGYSGIGYKTAGVRTLPLGATADKLYEPNVENCLSGDYPLARFLNIYVNKKPGQKLSKLSYEFLRFVLSKQGQEIVVDDGYFPLPAAIAEEALKSME